MRLLATGLTAAVAAVAAAAAVRYVMIEPREIGALCQAGLGPWWCPVRQALVVVFRENLLGLGALVLAVLGYVGGESRAARVFAVLAVALGAVALVLYNAGLGAPALLLGLMRVARLDRMVRA
ncbi:MAG: hypothetical protein H7840_09835 [Alphaproteobacteria bacterium]